MNNACSAIADYLSALDVDINSYEAFVRCYILAKLNNQHSTRPNYDDGIFTSDFDIAASRYHLHTDNADHFVSKLTFSHFCSEISQKKWS